MSMQTDMVAYLNTISGITSLVGTRVYPDPLPQNATMPALTYSQVSGVRVRNIARGPAGKARIRIAISCWGSTKASTEAVAIAVRQGIDGFNGWWADTFIGSVALENEIDLHEESAGQVSVGVRRVVQDYIISHLET